MVQFLASRILQGIVVVLAVLVITFFLQKLSPSSPFNNEREIPPEQRARFEEYFGFNKRWDEQLWRVFTHYATLNPPNCMKKPGRGVGEIIVQAFPVSLAIAVPSLLIALLLGIPLGAIAALKPHTWQDRTATFLATLGVCLPSLVLGPIVALIFGLWLGWFNVSGWMDPGDWVLPSLTLGFIYSGPIARLTRGGLRETLVQDFIRTARAKGVDERGVVVRHAMKLACLPVLNYLGPAVAGLLTGSFVIETVFQIPGLGQHFVNSAFENDHNLAMGITLFFAVLVVVFNILVDLLQAAVNPKIGLKT
ncbi:ABC transporter permease [Roseimicrobium sp. ORNL1]|uniref:ABC transporter permease n=1 Tax=Roseimicrobium sp. ORNL1 TaxID=2711231 RepID=UPI0013E1822B|nr:ABC transporter permease [Roseimicrobium sp. ORNL1]QIF00454.1 ABC transporter permease [Roseimicrobium sp. ORNL1]